MFESPLPIPGPLDLELNGVPGLVPMHWNGKVWTVTIDLTEGVYTYRFRVRDTMTLNDCRRSTARNVEGAIWSVLLVNGEEGPVWVSRSTAKVVGLEVCQTVSEMNTPLILLNTIQASNIPFSLWLKLDNVFSDTFVDVVLVRPDGEVAYGCEFLVSAAKVSPNFSIAFALKFEVEKFVSGVWKMLVSTEGRLTTKDIPFSGSSSDNSSK